MNSEKIILTDHDSVAGQLVSGTPSVSEKGFNIYWAWGVLAVSVVLGCVVGSLQGENPTDRLAAALALLPLSLILFDLFWALVVVQKKVGGRALGLVGGAALLHFFLWGGTQYLASFDVFYGLVMQSEFFGVYETRTSIVAMLLILDLLALGGAVYTLGVMRELLDDFNIPIANDALDEDDQTLDGDAVFEAQALLNNLGYDIGGIDGVRGAKTETALKQFQSVVGLAPNGIVTEMTMRELRRRDGQPEQIGWTQTLSSFASYWATRIWELLQARLFALKNR